MKAYWRGGPTVNWLINQTPLNGCLLVFNAKHRAWRAEAAEMEILRVHKLSAHPVTRDDNKTLCDLYICTKD